MRRLVEEQGGSALDQVVRKVIATAPPLDDGPARQQRVRRALDTQRDKRGRPRWLAVCVAAALVCVLGGTALAMAPHVLRLFGRGSSGTPAPQLAPPPLPSGPAVQQLSPPPTVQEAASAVAAAPSTRVDPAPNGNRRTPSHAAEAPPPPSPSDIDLVHQAAKALRAGHDPARAARLLDSVHSPGPLAEEALALRIEAALDLHDPHAASLGSEYLARFPAGAYRDIATRAAGTQR